MSRKWLCLTLMSLSSPMLLAQTAPLPGGQPVAPGGAPIAPGGPPVATLPFADPARPPVQANVLAHLKGWESKMKDVNTFAVTSTLTRKDLTTKRESKFIADIWCMKPNLARMSLKKETLPGEKPNPSDMMAYICTGKAIYEYDGAKKKLTSVPLGPNGFGNHLLLDLMGGMTAQAATTRFDISLLKEDQNYIYLEVKPVVARDREEFQTMTLVLCNPSNPANKGLEYIPRMVVLRQANGQQEEIWDFPKPMVNPKEITEQHFKPELPGKDWTVENLQPPKPGAPVSPAGSGGRIPTPGGKQ